MYHVECIDIHKDDALYMYLDRACSCANNMRNTANFYIRNLMTGLKKVPSARTENEAFVIETVSGAVPGINRQLLEKRDRKVLRIMGDKSLSEEARAKKAAAVKYLQFTVPTAEKWFASYGLLDAVFKHTGNRDYRAFHAHVMQNAVRDCCEAWLSYFEGLKAYAPGSGHTGKPKIPGYKKSGGRSTAVFSSLACTAAKYGIRVIFQEESYTSKACFSARDPIPVFGRENGTPSFSGERVSRGLYRQPDGRVINADINGSLNIGCKYDSRIFPEGKDYSYLYGTVKSMTYSRILGESRRRNDFLMWHTTIKAVPVKRDSGRSVRPVSAKAARSPRLLAYAKAVG